MLTPIKIVIIPMLGLLLLTAQAMTQTADQPQQQQLRPAAFPKDNTILLNFGNNLFPVQPSITAQPMLSAEFCYKQVSFGPHFCYFQFKESRSDKLVTHFINDHVRYHHFLAGVKATVHLTEAVNGFLNTRINSQWLDVYLGLMGGYSFIHSSEPDANAEVIEKNERLRGELSLGLRSMVIPKVGFFLEGKHGSYAYCAFGISFAVGKE